VDSRADLYSLGCVAYWLLTGQPVFQAETAVATALAHVSEPPVAASVRSEIPIPPDLDALILDCLAKDPANRPESADVVSARLAAVACPSWTPQDARKWWALHGPLGALSAVEGADRSAAMVLAKRQSGSRGGR
jgi:serine/threonine-protein kinase